ncbi:hypothetical protein A0H81_02816 [Grifola frondosa]|uniref:Uncharacterized protein n=1 Tax=Grifola frondosa TaxID=5627 RepID=A0A1C7MS86_GRIFR|nr:hypothetical protein A0H81_02816 [Grifola frondosa]
MALDPGANTPITEDAEEDEDPKLWDFNSMRTMPLCWLMKMVDEDESLWDSNSGSGHARSLTDRPGDDLPLDTAQLPPVPVSSGVASGELSTLNLQVENIPPSTRTLAPIIASITEGHTASVPAEKDTDDEYSQARYTEYIATTTGPHQMPVTTSSVISLAPADMTIVLEWGDMEESM